MDDEAKKLRALIESSDKILIITHISPDPDALCSLLLAGTTLEKNYPDKQVNMNSEELTGGLDFLEGYQKIHLQPLYEAMHRSQPDLVIMTDAMNFDRCTRQEAASVRNLVKEQGIKLAIIDHHQPEAVEENAVYINQGSPAATQDVYETLFNALGLQKPAGYAQTTLLGIVSDTNRFMYNNPRQRATFAVVSDLLDAGASIEELENKRNRFTINEVKVLAELATNAVAEKGYSYSFIGDEFKKQWFDGSKTPEELKLGCQVFINEFIRNLEANLWGFVVYPDLMGGPDLYSVSFRSVSGEKDVAELAKALGGGGHKASAGAKFKAESVAAAITKVKSAIEAPKL